MQDLVNSVAVDEEGYEPESIEGQVKRIPIKVIFFLVEILLESDCKRRPDDIEKDGEGKNTVPQLDELTMNIEFVPGEIGVRILL